MATFILMKSLFVCPQFEFRHPAEIHSHLCMSLQGSIHIRTRMRTYVECEANQDNVFSIFSSLQYRYYWLLIIILVSGSLECCRVFNSTIFRFRCGRNENDMFVWWKRDVRGPGRGKVGVRVSYGNFIKKGACVRYQKYIPNKLRSPYVCGYTYVHIRHGSSRVIFGY